MKKEKGVAAPENAIKDNDYSTQYQKENTKMTENYMPGNTIFRENYIFAP
jgi:hypothetical protein